MWYRIKWFFLISFLENENRDPTASLIFGRPPSPTSDDTPRRTTMLDERNSVTSMLIDTFKLSVFFANQLSISYLFDM